MRRINRNNRPPANVHFGRVLAPADLEGLVVVQVRLKPIPQLLGRAAVPEVKEADPADIPAEMCMQTVPIYNVNVRPKYPATVPILNVSLQPKFLPPPSPAANENTALFATVTFSMQHALWAH
jgi:hypothetical protein